MMQIAGEWPGVFIRGDDALSFAAALSRSLAVLGELAHANRDKLEDSFPVDLDRSLELMELLQSLIMHPGDEDIHPSKAN